MGAAVLPANRVGLNLSGIPDLRPGSAQVSLKDKRNADSSGYRLSARCRRLKAPLFNDVRGRVAQRMNAVYNSYVGGVPGFVDIYG
jgi:hypothetical protein